MTDLEMIRKLREISKKHHAAKMARESQYGSIQNSYSQQLEAYIAKQQQKEEVVDDFSNVKI
jgi:hypothetical protein